MSTVVIIGIPGQADLWQADLNAGTVTKLKAPATGALADAQKLRSAGATITKGVNLAVAVSTQSAVASGEFDG